MREWEHGIMYEKKERTPESFCFIRQEEKMRTREEKRDWEYENKESKQVCVKERKRATEWVIVRELMNEWERNRVCVWKGDRSKYGS